MGGGCLEGLLLVCSGVMIAATVLERHIKVRGEANPYDPDHTEYFERRRCFAWRTLPRQRIGKSIPAGV
jgi:hypothetical protein